MKRDTEDKMQRVQALKARVTRSEYEVDPQVVADAIVRRAFQARLERTRALAEMLGDAVRPSSGDVLETG